MVPGSLGNNGIFEKRHAGGKENHGEILAGGAKGGCRKEGCSMASRFAKDRSNGGRGCLYRQSVKRSGNLLSPGRDLSRNAGSSATPAHREFSLRPRALCDWRHDPASPKFRTRDSPVRGARGAGRAAQRSIRRRRGAEVVCFLLRMKATAAIGSKALLPNVTSQELRREPNNLK